MIYNIHTLCVWIYVFPIVVLSKHGLGVAFNCSSEITKQEKYLRIGQVFETRTYFEVRGIIKVLQEV